MRIKKTKKITSLIFTLLLVFSLFGFSSSKARAGYWGESMQAAAFRNLWKTMYDKFRETMRGALKRQASNLIIDRVESLLSGRSSRSLMITNYEDYIFGNARRQAVIFSNDFFRSITRNVSSSTNSVQRSVEKTIESEISTSIEDLGPDLDNYVQGGADNLFDPRMGGGTSALMATITNPFNNAYGSYQRASTIIAARMDESQRSAEARAIAGQGFDSKIDSSSGLINLPGSITKEMVATAETLPMIMTANATSIPEVIGNMAAQVVSRAIESGIAKVTQPVDNKLSEVNRSVRGGAKSVQTKIYKGLKFSDN